MLNTAAGGENYAWKSITETSAANFWCHKTGAEFPRTHTLRDNTSPPFSINVMLTQKRRQAKTNSANPHKEVEDRCQRIPSCAAATGNASVVAVS